MDAAIFRTTQEPLRELYKNDAKAALLTLSAAEGHCEEWSGNSQEHDESAFSGKRQDGATTAIEASGQAASIQRTRSLGRVPTWAGQTTVAQ
jgi:hypothetical protein